MSLIPYLMDFVREESPVYERNLLGPDEDFGFGIYPCEIYNPRRTLLHFTPRRRFTPYSKKSKLVRDSKENLTVGKDGFQVCMDVSHFKPNELTVKTVGNQVVVEGKHEEREDDHGYISRQFVRKYSLPKGYDSKDVVSTVSSDGVLTVKAAPPSKSLKSNERIVQIQQTGPAHLSVKSNEQIEANGTTDSKKKESKEQSS